MTSPLDGRPARLFDSADMALLDLLGLLKDRGYAFVAPTPATHARVLARPERRQAVTITDIFGWSLPFDARLLPVEMIRCLRMSDMLEECGTLLRSRVRASALHGDLYLHSAYPTDAEDSVFFGPDSYRFADLIARELAACPERPATRIADIGSGAGVGAIVAAKARRQAYVIATDLNPAALRLARINAAAANVTIDTVETSGLDGVDPPLDLVTLNPPYIIDDDGRMYRDGGGMHGAQLSLDLTRAAIKRLAPGGRVILYTGSAIVRGEDALQRSLAHAAAAESCALRYAEIDPDVFGEELEKPQYREVDRIALVSAIVTRS